MPTGATPEDEIPLEGIDYQRQPPAQPYTEGQSLTWIEPSHFIQGNGDVEKKFYWPSDNNLMGIAREVASKLLSNEGSEGMVRESNKLIQCSSECRNTTTVRVGGTNGGSANTFVANSEKGLWLLDTYNISVVEMETAAAAQVAHTNNVPFIGIRGISDDGSGDLVIDQGGSTEIDSAAISMKNAVTVIDGMLLRLCSDATDFGNDPVTDSDQSTTSAAALSTLTVSGFSMAAVVMWYYL